MALDSQVSRPVAAVVLAAGRGTRAGGPKALLELDGQPAVVAQVDRLKRAGCDPVIAVVNAEVERSAGGLLAEQGATVVMNDQVELGPLLSLRLGIGELPDTVRAVLVLPVDFLHVRGATLRALADAAGWDRIVIPVHRDRRGHPPVIGGAFLRELSRLPLEEGLRGLYRRVGKSDIFHLAVTDDGILRNVNTRADLEEGADGDCG